MARPRSANKRSREGKTGTDRLSSLDDSLLLHILGLLETQDAVRTCVLSKRWRGLWSSLHVLSAGRYISKKHFSSKFVNQFLLRRDDCELHKVILTADGNWDIYAAEAVVRYAVKHGVREMYLDFVDRHGKEFMVSRGFSQCRSLRELELLFNFPEKIILPKKMGLTALTSLRLENIIFSEENFDGSLFSGSPNLQTLELLDICCESLVTFDIHAPSLRTLEFNFGRFPDSLYGYRCKVVIIAPKLTRFTFCGRTPISFSVDASSLEDVSIDCFAVTNLDNYLVLPLIEMVNEFRVARCMTMTLENIKAISSLPTLLDGNLLKFENLNHLKITSLHKRDVVLPPCILKYFLNDNTTLELCQI